MKTRAQTKTMNRSRRGGALTKTRTGTARRTTKGRARTAGRRTAPKRAAAKKSKSTTDAQEIQQWVESRGGHPALVRRGDAGGILRIDFPGFSGEGTLQPVSWDEW